MMHPHSANALYSLSMVACTIFIRNVLTLRQQFQQLTNSTHRQTRAIDGDIHLIVYPSADTQCLRMLRMQNITVPAIYLQIYG